MRRYSIIFTLIFLCCYAQGFSRQAKNVLIFSKTTGFRHESIEKGVETVSRLLSENKIRSRASEDASLFNPDTLATYDAVVFLSTTGDILNDAQKAAFQKFIQSGKGFVGIHAASDTEYNWPWYGGLVGGYFSSHPEVQEAQVDVLDQKHQSTKHLPRVWIHKDEWYDFKNVKEGLNILMTLDEKTYKGGKMGKFHPIAWFQKYDGGLSFYTGLGHTNESFDSSLFQRHMLEGIKFVLRIK